MLLREYPVAEVLAAYAIERDELGGRSDGEILESELYSVIPDCGADYALRRYRGLSAVKAV